eukprot:scaffold22156_cov148-Isochrysis_galbana.AAC.3
MCKHDRAQSDTMLARLLSHSSICCAFLLYTGVRKAATLTRLFPRVRTSEKKYENSVPPSRSMAPLPSGPP